MERHCTFERKALQDGQGSDCREHTTVTCGMLFQATQRPLTRRFLAMQLLTAGQERRLPPEAQTPSRWRELKS